jgi:hypothetical protein
VKYATVSAINNSLQAVGTCHPAGTDKPSACFWSTPNSTPIEPTTLPGNPRNVGVALNNLGHVILVDQDGNGRGQTAFWNPLSGATQPVTPIPGGVATSPAAFAQDADVLVGTGDNPSEHLQPIEWTPSGGTVAIPEFAGGQNEVLEDIAPNGKWAAGVAEDSTHTADAIGASLP